MYADSNTRKCDSVGSGVLAAGLACWFAAVETRALASCPTLTYMRTLLHDRMQGGRRRARVRPFTHTAPMQDLPPLGRVMHAYACGFGFMQDQTVCYLETEKLLVEVFVELGFLHIVRRAHAHHG